jgi:hypothetical protein
VSFDLESLVPVGSLLSVAGGILGWALAQARAVGRYEERVATLQAKVAALENQVGELDRSRIDQGRRLGTSEDRLKVIESDARRPPLLPRPGGAL